MGKTNLKLVHSKQKEVKKRQDQMESSRRPDLKFFKAVEGENLIRILPPWGDAEWPFLEIEDHKLGDRMDAKKFACPKKFGEQFCFTCDEVIPMLKEEDPELAQQLYPKARVFCNIIDRNNVKAGAQIWGLSYYHIYNNLLALFNDADYGDITDPEDGCDLVLKRSGKDFSNTRYNIIPKRKSTSIDESLCEDLPDLNEVFKPADTKRQKQLLSEELGLYFDDDEDPETPDDVDGEVEEELEEVTEEDFMEDEDDFDDLEDDDEANEADEEDEAEPETEDDDSDDDEVPFDSEEDEAEDGKSSGRSAIKVPSKYDGKPKLREAYIKKASKKSECFGELYDSEAEECDDCDGQLECAEHLEDVAPPKKPVRRRKVAGKKDEEADVKPKRRVIRRKKS